MSDICGTCRGTGDEPTETMAVIRGPDGDKISITLAGTKTCTQCKGLGEYKRLR